MPAATELALSLCFLSCERAVLVEEEESEEEEWREVAIDDDDEEEEATGSQSLDCRE